MIARCSNPVAVARRRIDGAHDLGAAPRSTLVAIGNFDGVHRGHQQVLAHAADLAREMELAPIVLTFDPHPSEVLGRGELSRLTTAARRVDLICAVDDDLKVVVQPFDLAFAGQSPEEFARRLLATQLGAAYVLVGENFRFGRRRAGDLKTLEALGAELGFRAHAETLLGDDAGAFSSTRVREALSSGDLDVVFEVLGRPHVLTGQVVQGDQRGRTIGVPTANLAEVPEAMPPHGVYAVRVTSDAFNETQLGVLNIGIRPTVAAGKSIEVHLLDFDADLYGSELAVHLIRRLRDERKFAGLDELKRQISLDIEQARDVL